jgi:Tol biopolymer transport system component
MSKHRAVVFFILSFSFCVFAGSAHCQSPSESPKWQVKKLAIEVSRGSSEPEGDIFIIDPVNTKPRRLVEGVYPAWSPDGERIAYGTRSGHGYGQIYVINADGSGRRQLTNVNGGTFFPDWSPDGEKIAFTVGLGSKSPMVWVMNKDGDNAKPVTEGSAARWSPDGSRLAFFRAPKNPGGKGSMWVVNADGTGGKKVRDDDSAVFDLTWHPDGNSIAFATEREHKSAIFRVGLDGTDLGAIASDKRVALFFPVFAPDGLQLLADAFSANDTAPVLELGWGKGTILLVDLTGHPTKVLAHGIHPTVVWARQ